MNATQQQQEEAREQLRALLPPGSTVYTVLKHVSRCKRGARLHT